MLVSLRNRPGAHQRWVVVLQWLPISLDTWKWQKKFLEFWRPFNLKSAVQYLSQLSVFSLSPVFQHHHTRTPRLALWSEAPFHEVTTPFLITSTSAAALGGKVSFRLIPQSATVLVIVFYFLLHQISKVSMFFLFCSQESFSTLNPFLLLLLFVFLHCEQHCFKVLKYMTVHVQTGCHNTHNGAHLL